MKTFDHGFENGKGKIKRKKGNNSNLKKVQRYVASLNKEQISRMVSDSGKSHLEKGTDVTGESIYKKAKNTAVIQPKLEISQPNDRSEQQADKVAAGVTKGDTNVSKAALEQPVADINTKGEGSAMTTTPGFDQQLQGTKGQGQKLNGDVKSEMENHLGSDLSGVNIHTSGNAKSMSEDINAKAFTHGQDVYFNQGQYNPASVEGKSLLAHELTHTVQQGRGKVQAKIQRFGAESHEKVESNALTKEKNGKKGLNSAEAHATYYGNWTRDFNQFLAPGYITNAIGLDGAYTFIAFMAAVKFGKVPSFAELGVYNPKEHIDNPGAIHPEFDIYADGKQLQNKALSPKDTNAPKPTPQTKINTGASNQSGKTETRVGLLSVDQTGVMAYIRDTNLHVESRLEQAVDKGRTDNGLFHFGVALHAIEDLFAHSNYVEIALSKILKDDPTLLASQLKGDDRDVYKYMPSIKGTDGKNRAVLTTGTFSGEDAKISLAYEAIDFIKKFDLEGSGDIKLSNIAENAFINLLSALSERPAIKKALGKEVGVAVAKAIGIASTAIKIEKMFEATELDELYRTIKSSLKNSKDLFESMLRLAHLDDLIELPDLDKILLKWIVKKTLKWLKEKLAQFATGDAIHTRVAKTPLNEEKERLKDEKDKTTGEKKHLEMYKKRETQSSGKMLLSGPSHSQLAKDHPQSIFFGLAFKLASEADQLLRDKLMVAWKGKPVQSRSEAELQKGREDIAEFKKGGATIEALGSTSKDIYNIETKRDQACDALDNARDALRQINKHTGNAYIKISYGLYNTKKALQKLDLYDYESREKLYRKLDGYVTEFNTMIKNKNAGNITKAGAAIVNVSLIPALAFIAPAFYHEQKNNISHTKPQTIAHSTINQSDLSSKSPAVRDLLKTSRMILGHPNDSDWWKPVVKNYIAKFPAQIAMEIKLKNAGYVDKQQTQPYKIPEF
ncbi:MAG: hypothetical protein JWP12_2509 [Bacteroidetes bacterium]|nr:hypothetical protein [Bacteroidota bacterium]